MTLGCFETRTQAVKNPFFFWRGIARTLEVRWRGRSTKLRTAASAPQHPADEQGEAAAKGVDTLAVREITADDIRFHFAAAQPRTLAQQSSAEKPRKGDANSTIQRNPPRMSRAERRRQDFLQQSVMQPEIRMPDLDSAEYKAFIESIFSLRTFEGKMS